MSGKRCLLDTNIVAAILNQEPGLEDRLKNTQTFLSNIVLGELYFGAFRSGRVDSNLARIEAFLGHYPLMTSNKKTALEYGRIKQQLASKGRPIPENDIWIAALAIQYSLTLITRDEHFKHVAGLTLETW